MIKPDMRASSIRLARERPILQSEVSGLSVTALPSFVFSDGTVGYAALICSYSGDSR